MADPLSIGIGVGILVLGAGIAALSAVEAPRLENLNYTSADYGASLTYLEGTRRLDDLKCIWAKPLRVKKAGGKAKGGKATGTKCFATWALQVCDQPNVTVLQLWFDKTLVYDATGAGPISPFALGDNGGGPVGEALDALGIGNITDYMTFYDGADDQEPDPVMAADVDAKHGPGSTPAYRGQTTIVFKELPVDKLGNRFPQVSALVTTNGTEEFPLTERTAGYLSSVVMTLSEDGRRLYFTSLDSGDPSIRHLEGWDVVATAPMFHVERTDIAVFKGMGIDDFWRIYTPRNDQNALMVLGPEGGALLKEVGPPDITWGANYLDFPAIDSVTVLDNVAYCSSWSLQNHGWRYVYPADKATLLTASNDGDDFQWKFFFKDAYGGHWALGGGGDLAGDEIVIERLLAGVDSPATVGLKRLTMPVSNGGAITGVRGFHCHDAGDDYLIVRFGLGTGCVVALDWADLEIANQLVGEPLADLSATTANALLPGSRYVWTGGNQWDYVNMTIVRDIDATDWDPTYFSDQTTLFDRLSNALIRVSGTSLMSWLYLDRATGGGRQLRDVVERVSALCGLDVATEIDATDLTQPVEGVSWTQGPGKSVLAWLLDVYDSEARPHDFKVEFLRRGSALGALIPVSEMGAGGGAPYEAPQVSDLDLPRKVNLTYADTTKDQQPNTAIGQRSGEAVDSDGELSVDASPLALSPDEARPMADGLARRAWIRAQTYKNSLSRLYSALECGDGRPLDLDGEEVGAKVTKLEIGADGVWRVDWERYFPHVHEASALPGAPGDGLTPDELVVFGLTRGVVLDIPLAQDGHDAAAPFVYLAAGPFSDTSWPGATFNRGDDGETYDEALGGVAPDEAATIGYAVDALPDALATVWDRRSVLTVTVLDGVLTSVTEGEAKAGANLAAIRSGDDWELINYATATLVGDKTYEISTLLRGRRGTERATGGHAAGDTFVVLADLPRATLGADEVGEVTYVRPTTDGGPDGAAQLLDPYAGAALKPYSPAHLEVADVAGDLVGTWVRRTRVGGNWSDYQDVPLGEGSEAYVGQVLDAGGAVIRTFSGLTTPTLTYTAAQQATDGGAGVTLRVMQVSSVVGNGYATDVAI